MELKRRAFCAISACWVATTVYAGVTAAQNSSWQPTKAVELIASSAPGGSNDKTARVIQKILQDDKLVAVPVNQLKVGSEAKFTTDLTKDQLANAPPFDLAKLK